MSVEQADYEHLSNEASAFKDAMDYARSEGDIVGEAIAEARMNEQLEMLHYVIGALSKAVKPNAT